MENFNCGNVKLLIESKSLKIQFSFNCLITYTNQIMTAMERITVLFNAALFPAGV